MPITRRKRANPPEQPENNNSVSAETTENGGATSAQAQNTPVETEQQAQPSFTPAESLPESNTQSSPTEIQTSSQPPAPFASNGDRPERGVEERTVNDRPERIVAERTGSDRPERVLAERANGDRQDTFIEGGRRTARGELFRRPPQAPSQPAQPVHTQTAAPPLPPPSHEITLPLGNLLHLSYNPGYTGADEARSQLLDMLTQESKKGGRARCWNCGSVAIKYDRWNTRSKTFGEIGVAICEICGVWSVM